MKKISHKNFRNTLANIFSVSLVVMLVSALVFFALIMHESKYTDHFSSMYGPTPAGLEITINVFAIMMFASMSACCITKWVDKMVMRALREARR